MLVNEKIKAFVPTVQPEQAKLFYRDVLGLEFLSEDPYALEFQAGATLLRIAVVRELTPHPFTALGWDVGDIKMTIRGLNSKEVFCEQFEFLEQDELGIWSAPGGAKVAWFKDSDGNLLSLTEYF